MSLMSASALQTRDELALRFRDAQPFRHVVVDDFFDPAFCQSILDEFPRFEDRFALNEMGEVGGKAVRMGVRELSPTYRELDAFLQTSEFLGYVSKVTGIPDLLYDADYIGGGTHENRDGQNLATHVDFNYHPRTNTHRRLNLIVYLNHEWEQTWGGALELHSDPWNAAANHKLSVLPLFNRAVIFETNEVSWHGFEEIRLPADRKTISRKSFAIYLYTKERPPAETAPAHATVYVPDGMPRDWNAGRVLDDADINLLRARFIHLRGQLKYLYEREKHDSGQIDILKRALDEARVAWRLPMQGYVTQDASPQGMWDDGWVSSQLQLSLVPQRMLTALEIELTAPAQLARDQVLTIDVDGRRWEHHIARGSHSTLVLKLKRAAGTRVALRIDAAAHFVPAERGESGDNRELAWMLREARVMH
ncbi:2OG-Fe(II) oxygenase [Rudaea sp.]|uniref:2OG-Fe(II) oxygenase n=1 Tax=Rudaea sp. TaxID=2136325 RepID=UPI002ECFE970